MNRRKLLTAAAGLAAAVPALAGTPMPGQVAVGVDSLAMPSGSDGIILDLFKKWAATQEKIDGREWDEDDPEFYDLIAYGDKLTVAIAKIPSDSAAGIAIKSYLFMIAFFGCGRSSLSIGKLIVEAWHEDRAETICEGLKADIHRLIRPRLPNLGGTA